MRKTPIITFIASLVLLLATNTGCVQKRVQTEESTSAAESVSKHIVYAQQEYPGELVVAKINQDNSGTYISTMGFGKGAQDLETPVSAQQFKLIWDMIHSSEMEKYRYTLSPKDSLSEARAYTLELKADGAKLFSLRIPVNDMNATSKTLIDTIKQLISEMGGA